MWTSEVACCGLFSTIMCVVYFCFHLWWLWSLRFYILSCIYHFLCLLLTVLKQFQQSTKGHSKSIKKKNIFKYKTPHFWQNVCLCKFKTTVTLYVNLQDKSLPLMHLCVYDIYDCEGKIFCPNRNSWKRWMNMCPGFKTCLNVNRQRYGILTGSKLPGHITFPNVYSVISSAFHLRLLICSCGVASRKRSWDAENSTSIGWRTG